MSKKSRLKNKKSMKEEHKTPLNEQEQEMNTVTSESDQTTQNVDKETEATSEIPLEQKLQLKIEELNDKYLRLYSEFDNYRKRTQKERLELSRTASADVIIELLPVMDDFERAIKSTADSTDCIAVKEGVNLIFSKFKGIMEKKGVKAIDAIGQEFNTDFHEAITYIPAPTEDMKNKIVDEVEKGYFLGDKVIRYSKVVIGQ
jgi:molecular chaperone GrpE